LVNKLNKKFSYITLFSSKRVLKQLAVLWQH
jgi:hypothetical protein